MFWRLEYTQREDQMAINIEKYLEDINPDIVVITGHDSLVKKIPSIFLMLLKSAVNIKKIMIN